LGNGASSFDPFSQRGDVHNNTYSAFAQGSFNLTPALSLTAGVRYTKDEKEMVISTHTPTACAIRDVNGNPILVVGGDFSNCKVDLSDSFSKPTGTLSLDYKMTDNILLYATSRYGYRAGGFNLRGTAPLTYVPFQPETVLDFEVGTKADWAIGPVRMRSNVAIYNQWYDDIQRTVGVSNPAGVPGSAVQNAAKAEVFGVELQQTIAPTRNLSIQLNYAFTNPKYKNWTEVGSDAIDPTLPLAQRTYPTVDLSNTPFHFTPKHAASATITYTIPLANPGEELSFSAGAAYRSHVYINALQTSAAIDRIAKFEPEVLPFIQQSGFTTFDLNAGWKGILGTPLDVSAYVKNAANKEYVVGGIQLYESAYHSVSRIGIIANAYGEPRTFGAELRYHF
jgi:iron complex outermembrane receptor protein